jgi:hypothetical protein
MSDLYERLLKLEAYAKELGFTKAELCSWTEDGDPMEELAGDGDDMQPEQIKLGLYIHDKCWGAKTEDEWDIFETQAEAQLWFTRRHCPWCGYQGKLGTFKPSDNACEVKCPDCGVGLTVTSLGEAKE